LDWFWECEVVKGKSLGSEIFLQFDWELWDFCPTWLMVGLWGTPTSKPQAVNRD
jgi:hypothetical protein